MAPPKGHKWYGGGAPKGHKAYPGGGGSKPITENTPLTPNDWRFVHTYINSELATHREIGKATANEKIQKTKIGYSNYTQRMLRKPNVKKEIERLMAEMTKKTIADSNEVMEYFSSVMRGEVKDQFGLDAPLSERTNAAKELAKRTVDVDLRKQGVADNQLKIQIDWGLGGENNE